MKEIRKNNLEENLMKKPYCSAFHPDASETVAYNNPLFPVYTEYGFLSSYPDYSCISHWHEDLEFILIKKGAMTYNVNGTLVELAQGCGILVNSRQLHYGFSAAHQECEFICILFSPELLAGNDWFFQNYVSCITGNSNYPYLYLTPENWTGFILQKIASFYGAFHDLCANPLSYFDSISVLTAILKQLYAHLDLSDQSLTAENTELSSLRHMIAYIEEHYAEHISLTELALSGACCKSRCALLFKKYLRDTPIGYTTKLRLRKSLTALLDSDRTIADIAYEYGFNGASYYCETFKKYYGESPKMYKRRVRARLP